MAKNFFLKRNTTIVIGIATIVVDQITAIMVFCDNCGFLRQLWLVLRQLWLIATIVKTATSVITS